MYGRANLAQARNHYKSLELASRVEAASPHALVTILYDELMRSLDVLGAALRQGRALGSEPHAHRARAILTALAASLDFDQGGNVATILGQVYRAMTRQLAEILASGDAAKLSELRTGVGAIADSWRQVARN